jgi:RHS repeat-associated protein
VWNASNTKVAEYKYDPYGYEVASSGSLTQPLRWKGREYDAETGLIYMRARYYDPTVGRFISEDPIGLAGGINPYTFADGESVNNSDPTGKWCFSFSREIFGLWHISFNLGCGKRDADSDRKLRQDPPEVFSSNFGKLGVRGDGPDAPGDRGGSAVAPVVRAVAAAGSCVGRAGLFGGALALDMSLGYRGARFGVAAVQLGGATIESFVATALNVGAKRAARGVLDASETAVTAAAQFGASYLAPSGLATNFAVGAVDDGVSWAAVGGAFIPFNGTIDRFDRAWGVCGG